MSAVPELRFPGFDGEWLARPLENLCSTVTSGSRDWAKYYSDAGSKFIRMTNLSRDNTRLLLDDLKYVALPSNSSEGARTSLCSGDVLISITAELGKIGLVPHDLGEAFINQHTALVRPSPKDAVPAFLAQCLATKMSNKRLNRLNDSGAKSGLNLSTVRSFEVRTPALPEQQKIAAFLGAVDNKIDALRRKHDALKQFKAGLMQKLFSQELRFMRDDGSDYPDWDEKRLGDIATFKKGKGISKVDIDVAGKTPCIRYGEIYTAYREVISDIISSTNVPVSQLLLSEGGEVIIPASGEDPLDMARACCVARAGVALGGDINIISGIKNGVFLAYYLNNAKRRDIARLAQGISVSHLYSSHLSGLTIEIPHPEEQAKIADCLYAMDAKVEAVESEITHMTSFKAGLLQKMFV